MEIDPANARALLAADGWLDLGLPAEAAEELAAIPAPLREKPEVLHMQWRIEAVREHWEDAVGIAEKLVAKAPEFTAGWIHYAYAVRRSSRGGLEKAREILLKARERFPSEKVIPYNLACYAAQQNQLDEAWRWLQQAIATGGLAEIKAMALADEDLSALWDRIREL